jgi:hypothetical protein
MQQKLKELRTRRDHISFLNKTNSIELYLDRTPMSAGYRSTKTHGNIVLLEDTPIATYYDRFITGQLAPFH